MQPDRWLSGPVVAVIAILLGILGGWVSAAAYDRLRPAVEASTPIAVLDFNGIVRHQMETNPAGMDQAMARLIELSATLGERGYLVLDSENVLGLPQDGSLLVITHENFRHE